MKKNKSIKIGSQASRKLCLDYLQKNKLMTLGTTTGRQPWGATVFFAFDEFCNIFFYSRPDTKHSQHLSQNKRVSVVINQDHGVGGKVKGMQIVGKASLVPKKDFLKSYATYKKRFPWAKDFEGDHRLYIVKPTEIHYIDQKRFGHFFRVRMK